MKGLDLRKFKKIKVENDHTLMRHPSGHEIKISHNLISKDLKKQLDKIQTFSDGGTVKEESEATKQERQKVADSFKKSTQEGPIDKIKHAFGYAEGGVIEGEEQPVMASKLESQYIPEEYKAQQMSTPQPQSDPRADLAFAIKNLSAQYATPAPQPMATPTPQGAPTPAPAPTPGPIEVGPQQPMQQAPELQPQVSMQPQPGPQQSQSGNWVGQAQQAVGQQNQAESQMAQNTQQAMGAKADILGQQVNQLQELRSHYEDMGNQLHNKFETLSAEVAQGKVDPGRWWDQKSTGSKVFTAIGMLFAGAGGGIAGHPEMVGNVINKAIDRDIEAQKADLSNKNTVLGKYLEMYKDLPQAEAAARLTMGAAVEGMINQQAAKLGGENAVLLAQQVNAQRRQALLPTLEGLAKGQVMANMYQGMSGPQQQGGAASGSEQAYRSQVDKMQVLNPERAKAMQGEYLPGIGIAQINVSDTVRKNIVDRKDLSDKLARLELFADKNQGSMSWTDPQTVAEGQTLAQEAKEAFRVASGMGALSGTEAKGLEKLIDADPTKFFAQLRSIPKYKALREANNRSLKQLYKAYGVQEFKNSQEGSPNTRTINGKQYTATPQGWKLVK